MVKKQTKQSRKKKADTTLPILTHVLGLVSGFLGPLIVLLASDDEEHRNCAKLVLNWQFSFFVYIIVSLVLMFAFPFVSADWKGDAELVGLSIFFFILSIFVMTVIGILNTVFSIVGAVKSSEYKLWKYPLSIPFFKVEV